MREKSRHHLPASTPDAPTPSGNPLPPFVHETNGEVPARRRAGTCLILLETLSIAGMYPVAATKRRAQFFRCRKAWNQGTPNPKVSWNPKPNVRYDVFSAAGLVREGGPYSKSVVSRLNPLNDILNLHDHQLRI